MIITCSLHTYVLETTCRKRITSKLLCNEGLFLEKSRKRGVVTCYKPFGPTELQAATSTKTVRVQAPCYLIRQLRVSVKCQLFFSPPKNTKFQRNPVGENARFLLHDPVRDDYRRWRSYWVLQKGKYSFFGWRCGSGLVLILAGYLSLKAFERRKNSYIAFIIETGGYSS